jgi:hypothetical protein
MIKYLTPKQIMIKYPYFCRDSLYRLLRNRENNGLKSAVTAIGNKKLLVNEELFDEWFKSSPQT